MGVMVYHAIVVSSHDEPLLRAAHAEAVRIGMEATEIRVTHWNGIASFCVLPDGSKEGWGPSDDANDMRDELIEWMRAKRHDDGSSSLHWCEVQYGGDDEGIVTQVLRRSP